MGSISSCRCRTFVNFLCGRLGLWQNMLWLLLLLLLLLSLLLLGRHVVFEVVNHRHDELVLVVVALGLVHFAHQLAVYVVDVYVVYQIN